MPVKINAGLEMRVWNRKDMTLQICNSTDIQCTMHSYRSLMSLSLDDLQNKPGLVANLVTKMLTTMTPVIGIHKVGNKWVRVEEYTATSWSWKA